MFKIQIPKIGIGTYKFATDEKKFHNSVLTALSAGYRMFDTAPTYFCEEWLGNTLSNCIRNGLIERKDLFIQSKFENEYPYGYYDVFRQLEESLNKLQIDYIDGYIIHKPVPYHCEKNYVELNLEVWDAMCSLQKQGKIKTIGVSNFAERHIESLSDNGLPLPQINQIEINPFFQQIGLVNWCKKKGIIVQAWSPLARGEVFNDDILASISSNKDSTIAQICIKWLMDRDIIPIIGGGNPNDIINNINVNNISFTDEELNKILSINSSDRHWDLWLYKRAQMY